MVFLGIVTALNGILYKHKSSILLVISFIALLFYSGFRSETVGTDTINYLEHFVLVDAGVKLPIEPLWYGLIKVVQYFNGDFQHLLFCSSVLTLFPIFYVSYKKSPFSLLSIFFYITLYYYFYSFNITRQCIALSFVFLGMYYFFERKKAYSFSVLLIAFLFHYSALIAIFGLLIYNLVKKLSKKQELIIVIFSFLVGLFLNDYLLSFFQTFIYGNYEIDDELNLLGNMLNLVILNTLFFLVQNIIDERKDWFYMFFYFIIFSNLLARIPYANRFTMYFGISLIVFLPLFLNNNKLQKKEQGVIYFGLIGYSLYIFIRSWGSGGILPYYNALLN